MKKSRLSLLIAATVVVALAGVEVQAQFAPQGPSQPEIPREQRSQAPVGGGPVVASPLVTEQTAPTANQSAVVEPTGLNRCSQLIGAKVENPQGQHLGKIANVVVDFNNGRVSYCVLKVNDRISSTPKYVAVPLNAMRPSPEGSYVILNTDRSTLAQAQGFDYNNTWPAVTAPAWGAQPTWTPQPQGIAPSSHEMNRAQ